MALRNAVNGAVGRTSSEQVRLVNSTLVLTELRRLGQLAHTEICEATGLSSATVSAITADLESRGIIARLEQQSASGRGRPRISFGPGRSCGYVIAVIISSDTVEYSLVDYGGTLIDRFAEARRQAEPAIFNADLKAALARLAERSAIRRDRVLAISISSKGLVDPERPVLVWSPLLGTHAIDFAALLGDDWPAPVLLSNETLLVADALAGRRAEQTVPESISLAALSLGHSIGLGVARRSAGGVTEVFAPNFGHMLHEPDGALCRCGSSGCIEAYAGFYAILRSAFGVPLNTLPARFVPLVEIDRIAAQARQGSHRAQHAFRQAGSAIGNGLSRLMSLYGHMPVYLTGPGTQYFDLMRGGIEQGIAQGHVFRLFGNPSISVFTDERSLVFEGHLGLAFSRADRDITHLRPPRQAAGG